MVDVYNYKTHIFSVDMDEKLHVRRVGEIKNESLMPFGLKNDRSATAVEKWIKSRLIPGNRIGSAEVYQKFGNIPDGHGMFSLTDQYWFKWKTHESWQNNNFFTNTFSSEYGRMYFEPWTVNTSKKIPENPDMTTNGVLPKRWIQGEDKTAALIKMGSREAHQDPISEVLASMTLERLDIIPFVKYELIADGLRFCCICKNFISEGQEFIPASDLYFLEKRAEGEDRRSHLLNMIKKYTPEIEDAEDFLDRMAVADYCVGNNDRHTNNFGFIRDCKTGKMIGFAPLFDSGSAFFGNANKDGAKAKMFTNAQIEEAMARVFRKIPAEVAGRMKAKDLISFVDTYPMLVASEKEMIIGRINTIYEEIRNRLGANKVQRAQEEQSRE